MLAEAEEELWATVAAPPVRRSESLDTGPVIIVGISAFHKYEAGFWGGLDGDVSEGEEEAGGWIKVTVTGFLREGVSFESCEFSEYVGVASLVQALFADIADEN